MEEYSGHGVKMNDIAKKACISRQALYLHFTSKTDLMIATVRYVDEVKGLNERLQAFQADKPAIELLETCVEIWGNYMPEIHGIAKALLKMADTDKAAAIAWQGAMACLWDICKKTIEALEREGKLAPAWSIQEAIEMFYTMISIQNWEQLTIEFGWSNEKYIAQLKLWLKSALLAA